MESKIVMAEDWVHKYYHGNQSDILHLVKLAQKQAIEAAKEVVKKQAYGLRYEDPFDKNPTYVDVCEKCIDEIFDSEELKVL